MKYSLIHRRVIALDGAPLAKIESHVSLRKPQPPQGFNIDTFAARLVRLLNEAEGLVAAEEQVTRNRVELPPSSARERREIIEECAQEADIVLKSNFMARGAQLVDIVVPRIRARAALSSDGRGREKGNTSNSDDGIDRGCSAITEGSNERIP